MCYFVVFVINLSAWGFFQIKQKFNRRHDE
jgi:hypothetical protein